MVSEKENKKYMEEAFKSARRALDKGEIPVGAVVVERGRVIGRGHNLQSERHDPTAHAEIVALREAGSFKNNFRLDGALLFCTVKPCPMCAEAIKRARIKKVYYCSPAAREVTHSTKFEESAVLGEKSADILQEFFRKRR